MSGLWHTNTEMWNGREEARKEMRRCGGEGGAGWGKMVSWKSREVKSFNKEVVVSWVNASDGTNRVRKYSLPPSSQTWPCIKITVGLFKNIDAQTASHIY